MCAALLMIAMAGAALSATGTGIRPGDDGFLLGVGGGWIWTDPAENLESTWTLVPRLGYGLTRRWMLEGDFGIVQGQTRAWGKGYDAYTPRFNILFDLAPDSPFEPFVAAGAGIIWKKVHRAPDVWEAQAKEGENWGNFKNPDTDTLVNVGYGAFIKLAGPVVFRADFRAVFNLGTEPHGEIPDRFSDWELTAGLGYRDAERRRDTDGDGIVDRADDCIEDPEDFDRFEDHDGCPDLDNDSDEITDEDDDCPDSPEDYDEFQDRDGCPEDDNDQDGLVDWDDGCPNDAEDLDGFKDRDGCPDKDNDGDGLLDLDDRCPNVPEDGDEFDDWDGCPENDNDADGITDHLDACPDVKESWNGFEDDDGCPDTPPPPPPEIERFTGVIHGINFIVNSAEITVDSYRVLDEAASVLNKYPYVRIEVQGHTDSDGPDAFNLDLSARRACSVVDYLVMRAVVSDRLEWIGYGETRPLVPNGSPVSKAVNRRVEFHIIQDGTAEDAP